MKCCLSVSSLFLRSGLKVVSPLFAILLYALPCWGAPTVSDIVQSSDSVGKYCMVQVGCKIGTEASNPYWPYDTTPACNIDPHPNAISTGVGISVDGIFLPPDKTDWNDALIQPGFYYIPYSNKDSLGNTHVSSSGIQWSYPIGQPCFCIRFAPTQLGVWRYRIRVTDSGGTATSSEKTFECIASDRHGFVRVSDTDRRYFELSDGTYLPLIGIAEVDSSKFRQLSETGINLVRTWWQSSNPQLALFGAGGQGGDLVWRNLSYSTDYLPAGRLVVAKIPNHPAENTWQALNQTVAMKPLTKYELTATVKTVGVSGTGDYGLRLDAWTHTGNNTYTSSSLVGDNDWKELKVGFTTGTSAYFADVHLGNRNVSDGTAYCSYISLREDLGGGNFGPNLVTRPDFQAHTGLSPSISYLIDNQLTAAESNGIYLKAVIEEKGDSFFTRIQPDGKWGASTNNNVYASPTHTSRVLQQYYWRYLIARYGYSTALHSLEYVNEGDPFSDMHREAVGALSAFVSNYDINKHLVTTSNWHSFPPAMWTLDNSYADIHMYLGWGVASGGNRLWPGWDGTWTEANYNDMNDIGNNASIDHDIFHTGSSSLKLSIGTTSNFVNDLFGANIRFHCGAVSGHRIRVSAWCKGQNISPQYAWKHSGLKLAYSLGGGDWYQSPGSFAAPNGTYGWTYVKFEFLVPNVAAGHMLMEVMPQYYLNDSTKTPDSGVLWMDDIVVEDLDTHLPLNYDGGFENWVPESYDIVAGHCAYSTLARGFQYGKPTIRGETGICKQGDSSGEDQQLKDDVAGVWWKKLVWSHLDPGGLIDMYWWPTLLLERNYKYAKSYQNFVNGIQLSNGHFQDIDAEISNTGLRVLGQKDLTSNNCHLWIDNIPYNWKNVVDGVSVPAVSGTVTVSGLKDAKYQVEWWNTDDGTITRKEELQSTNGNLTLSVQNLQSDVACKIYLTPAKVDLRILVPSADVAPGQTVTVTVEYTNSGDSDGHDVNISTRVPAEMEYIPGSAEESGGAWDAQTGTVSWVINNIAAHETGTRTFKAHVK